MRKARILAALTLFGVVASVGLSGCGGSGSAGVLRLPLMGTFEPDPARAAAGQVWPESLVYAGLFTFDAGMDVLPELAVGLPEISPNGRTYDFTVRDDARFDDGRPVTAADVAYSFARALSRSEHSSAAWYALGNIQGAGLVRQGLATSLRGVRVLGARTIQVKLSRPDRDFLADLALPAASVLERSVVKHGAQWWTAGGSAAPFRIERLGSPIVLRPNPHYDQGAVQVRALDLEPISSTSQGLALYRKHKVDATPIPNSGFGNNSQSDGFVSTDVARAYYIVVRPGVQKTVRMTLAHTLDRSAFATSSSQIDPLYSVVPSNALVPLYAPAADPLSFVPEPIRGRPPAGSRIVVTASQPLRSSPVYRWLLKSWSGLRISQPAGASVGAVRLVQLGAVVPDPETWLRSAARAAGAESPAFDNLLKTAGDVAVSKGLAAEWAADNTAESMLLDQALVIPIGIQKQGYLVSQRVQGLSASPYGFDPTNENWASVSVG